MAFVTDDDKLLDEQNQQQQGQGGANQAVGGSTVVSGQGGSQVGGGQAANSGGVGAGGTGGWTNIQSYLGANKGDTGTADYTQKKIGDQFGSERQSLDTAAGDTVAQGQAQANKVKTANETYKDTIADASKDYAYQGNQTDAYTQKTQDLRGNLWNQYSGPTNFAYGFGDQTQKYGTALNDNQAFDTFLNDSYRERAGAPMTSGQLALQRQLDTTNDPLAQTRQNLLKDYAGLGDYRDQKVTETDAGLRQASDDYRNYQGQLKNNVNNYSFDQSAAQAKAEADARAAYQQARSAKYDGLTEFVDPNGTLYRMPGMSMGSLEDQMRDWQSSNPSDYDSYAGNLDTYLSQPANTLGHQTARQVQSARNFADEQTNKTKDTGDAEKRQWNTIMDLLNQSDRRGQGFNVRG